MTTAQAVQVKDDTEKTWGVNVAALTPEQVVKVDRKAGLVLTETGYGEVRLIYNDGRLTDIVFEVREKLT